jgi:hypothetical protein
VLDQQSAEKPWFSEETAMIKALAKLQNNSLYTVRIAKEGDVHFPTIADRGTSCHIISLQVALQLIKERIVGEMQVPAEPISIEFGIKSARTPVIGIIRGAGLIDEVYVVDNELPIMLISDTTIVDKGVIFIQDSTHLIGLAAGEIVVVGIRDQFALKTATASMWCLDLRALLSAPDPRVAAQACEDQHMLSAHEIAEFIVQHQRVAEEQKAAGHATVEEQEPCVVLYSSCAAKPTFVVADIRKARWLLKCLGISPFTVAKTIERDAWRQVESWLTPALLRGIGHNRGNIPGQLSTARQISTGGTGIKGTITGQDFSMDILGKWLASLWGCCFAVLFIDSVSGFKRVYGVNSKSDLADAVRRWCAAVVARGHAAPQFVRFDAGAEATKHGELTAGFETLCTELHLTLLPSAPKNQKTNPAERAWQTIDRRMANMFCSKTPDEDSWLAVPS